MLITTEHNNKIRKHYKQGKHRQTCERYTKPVLGWEISDPILECFSKLLSKLIIHMS